MPAPSRPARLVFLLQDLRFGGTQRQSLELARGLERERFAPEFWMLAQGQDLKPLAEQWGVPTLWLGQGQRVGPGALFRLRQRLRQEKIDLLLLLTVVPNIWGRLLGRRAGVPLIVGTCRGGGAPRRQYERWLWPLADHIIVNTAELKARLQAPHASAPDKVSVILNGVDLDYFSPPEPYPPSGPPVLLCVARLAPDKDQATLLAAFARLRQEHPSAELWLIGEGPLRARLERQAQALGLAGQVRFQPPVLDLRPYLTQARVMVLSSQKEALPNVVLEAMAAGLPVVATAVGGLPEVVTHGQNGLLVPPGDPAALAQALGQLLADPDRARALGRTGRQVAGERFSLPEMVRQHQAIFERLLAQGPRRGGPN